MAEPMYLGFDFGYKRIGVAVGQELTKRARPLATLPALAGVPHWKQVHTLMAEWRPQALVVGVPRNQDGSELYTTPLALAFAEQLRAQTHCPVHTVDEGYSTVEARAELFAEGGYRKIKSSEVDSLAACIILEQWLNRREDSA
jgi:putative Holliday junction resolvase